MTELIFHFRIIQSIAVNICSTLIFALFTVKDIYVLSFYILGIITLYFLSVRLNQITKNYD